MTWWPFAMDYASHHVHRLPGIQLWAGELHLAARLYHCPYVQRSRPPCYG